MAGAKPVAHLAVLIPPPRLHRHRYHGVLTPNAPLRLAATARGRFTVSFRQACMNAKRRPGRLGAPPTGCVGPSAAPRRAGSRCRAGWV